MGRNKSQRIRKSDRAGAMAETAGSPRSGRPAALVILLLAIHFALAVSSARHKSPTYDEVLHLTCGYTYWQTGDFRLGPPNPPLASLWAAMPIFAVPANLPRFDSPDWIQSNIYGYGARFFYGSGNDIGRILQRGRSLIAALSVALGLVVFLWSRKLFGVAGGFLSLTLYAFSPTLLAHAQLVTNDLTVTAFFLFAAGGVWRVFHKVTLSRLVLGALAITGLVLSKLTGFFILPIILALVAIQLLSREPIPVALPGLEFSAITRWNRLRTMAGVLAIQLVIVFAGIWAVHGFRYPAFRYGLTGQERLHMPHYGDSGMDPWEVQYRGQPGLKPVIEFGRQLRVLPEIYLYSIALGAQVTSVRSAFLNGHYSLTGFRKFFPLAFFYKTPIPLMALLLCGLAASTRGWRGEFGKTIGPSLYRCAPLWVLLAVYWFFAINSHINIGHRHILPTYPPLFVLAGAAAGLWTQPSRWGRAVVSTLAAAFVAGSLWIYPHYLAFFSRFAGGPAHGYRHLVDSSLDWGQDLIGLKEWLQRNAGDRPVFLAYFGNAPPEFYGLNAYPLPYEIMGYRKPPRIGLPRLEPGVYCISATRLQQVYAPDLTDWNREKEQAYWDLLPQMREFETMALDDEAGLEKQVQGKGPAFKESFDLFQRLRFAKLCAYLRTREPDTQIGYSILIYHLDEQDLRAALDPPAPASSG